MDFKEDEEKENAEDLFEEEDDATEPRSDRNAAEDDFLEPNLEDNADLGDIEETEDTEESSVLHDDLAEMEPAFVCESGVVLVKEIEKFTDSLLKRNQENIKVKEEPEEDDFQLSDDDEEEFTSGSSCEQCRAEGMSRDNLFTHTLNFHNMKEMRAEVYNSLQVKACFPCLEVGRLKEIPEEGDLLLHMARDHDILNTILARGGWRRIERPASVEEDEEDEEEEEDEQEGDIEMKEEEEDNESEREESTGFRDTQHVRDTIENLLIPVTDNTETIKEEIAETHEVENLTKCEVCDLSFSEPSFIARHMVMVHYYKRCKESFKADAFMLENTCTLCDFTSDATIQLVKHIATKHGKLNEILAQENRKPLNLDTYESNITSEGNNEGTDKAKKMAETDALLKQMKVKVSPATSIIPLEKKTNISKKNQSSQDKGEKCQMPSCNKTFSFPSKMASHMVQHFSASCKTEFAASGYFKNQTCTICESTKPTLSVLIQHIAQKHSKINDILVTKNLHPILFHPKYKLK